MTIFDTIEERADTKRDFHNDYIRTIHRNGEQAAIIIADEDSKNCGVEHPYQEIPHINALYVRQGIREKGIGTKLVEEMCDDLDANKIMVDCEENVKPFYEQLDVKVEYLRPYKTHRS